MLQLPNWRHLFAPAPTSVYCILVFPNVAEGRRLNRLPSPGTRLRSHGGHFYWHHWGRTFVVNEVLQSGKHTYTVFLVDRRQYLENLRERPDGDLAAELVELARRTRETIEEARRRLGHTRRSAAC